MHLLSKGLLLGGNMKTWSVTFLLAALATFIFFFLNVASGAFLGRTWLSDVAEMLVLVLACALFVVSTLMFEISGDRK